MAERILVPGIANANTSIDYDINPNGQSFLIDSGNHVFVVRELGQTGDDFSADEEIRRRVESTTIHTRNLPTHTLLTQHVILQGYKENGEPVELLGRFSPKVDNVKPLTDIPENQIVSNAILCKEIAKVNIGQLKILIATGKLPDSGGRGHFGSSLPRQISKITNRLTSNNILVGEENNQIKVFCDPDWCIEPKGNLKERMQVRAKYATLYLARATFFYGVSKIAPLVRQFHQKDITFEPIPTEELSSV